MKYPYVRDELLNLLNEDQEDISSYLGSKLSSSVKTRKIAAVMFKQRRLRRADRVLELLNEIGGPIIDNVGTAGSEAVLVIGVHSSLSGMKRLLQIFEQSYKMNSISIYNEAIPVLNDRICVLEKRTQVYGTQWLNGDNNLPFLYPVIDFDEVDGRRNIYNLGKLKFPTDMLNKSGAKSKITVPVKVGDQRDPTQKGFNEFAQEYLD